MKSSDPATPPKKKKFGTCTTNQRARENFRSQDKGFYQKAYQFLINSSISVQCSFFEDHLPRDFPSQCEFSGSD